MSKRAVILAGGIGRRLHPYTVVFPKPLMPLGSYPILEIVIRQLVSSGIDHITLAVNRKAEIIKAFCGTGERWNVRIDYSVEEKPLNTMGPLSLINNLPDNFLVMNGDVLTDMNFKIFYDLHVRNNNLFTISTCKREVCSEFGVIETDEDGLLRGFQEKPFWEYEVSMGIYMLSRKIMQYIPSNKSYGFDQLMIDLIKKRMSVYTKLHQGFWLDIGRPEDYAKAQEIFEKDSSSFMD